MTKPSEMKKTLGVARCKLSPSYFVGGHLYLQRLSEINPWVKTVQRLHLLRLVGMGVLPKLESSRPTRWNAPGQELNVPRHAS
jgi:hypothetical protein